MASFGIRTPTDLLNKLIEEQRDFEKSHCLSARHATNAAMTAYHLHEWVWGAFVKGRPDYVAAISRGKVELQTLQKMARNTMPRVCRRRREPNILMMDGPSLPENTNAHFSAARGPPVSGWIHTGLGLWRIPGASSKAQVSPTS
jgi:hypothetical protein